MPLVLGQSEQQVLPGHRLLPLLPRPGLQQPVGGPGGEKSTFRGTDTNAKVLKVLEFILGVAGFSVTFEGPELILIPLPKTLLSKGETLVVSSPILGDSGSVWPSRLASELVPVVAVRHLVLSTHDKMTWHSVAGADFCGSGAGTWTQTTNAGTARVQVSVSSSTRLERVRAFGQQAPVCAVKIF